MGIYGSSWCGSTEWPCQSIYGVYRPLNTERLNYDYIDSLLRTEAYRTTTSFDQLASPVHDSGCTRSPSWDIPVLCPPSTEQDDIGEYLERVTVATNARHRRARRQIDLVEEYRTRLIADVVTGKLDVREAASQLPDEDSEAEPIGENGPLADGQPGDLYSIDESVEDSVMEEEVTA